MDETIILYSTGCPRCKVLKSKLDQKGISYQLNDSVDDMQKLGITFVPVLKVGDRLMEFSEANKWVNEFRGVE